MAAVIQIEAAVVRPWTLTPSLKMTPAPMKPTPAITPWDSRLGSSRPWTPGYIPGRSAGR